MSTGNVLPPATASANAPPAASAAAPAKTFAETAAGPNKSNTTRKGAALLASILTQTGSGFGVGAMLAKGDSKGNTAGASLLIALASFIFVVDVVLRYGEGKGMAWIAGGTLLLSAAALLPYNLMKDTKTKGKAPAASVLPVTAGLWTLSALGFSAGLSGFKPGPMQGVILSIMYMALSAVAGYNMQTKSTGTGVFAATLVVLLMIFDGLGFRRATTTNAPAAAA